MPTIQTSQLPVDALLRKYVGQGAHTDCYVIELAWPVSQADYVEAFYTTRVFKLERLLLDWVVSRPSTDTEARKLARGERNAFAAWRVEGRTPNQLLMCDMVGRTRSWLMSVPIGDPGQSLGTRLYFGSAVVAVTDTRSGKATLGFTYRALLGFHKLYSRVLLHAAGSCLTRQRNAAP